ncbi:GldG family protein [Puniceicoccaceae bacterium K14]|nr:GldG family protein [Puniceicoccaceae bacterium K14]
MFDSFQSNRFMERIHAIAQVALVFVILACINYIGMRNYNRIDLTENRTYTLSAETNAYLQQLNIPINVIVTLSEQSKDQGIQQILNDVKGLLQEYEYATRDNGDNRISVEYLNVYQQTRRSRELEIENPNVIVFKSETRSIEVQIQDLYLMQNNEVRQFLGENVFTRSVLELSDESQPIVYFTVGHGEKNLKSVDPHYGASRLADELKSRNIVSREIDLSSIEQINEDASLLIIAGPVTSFLPQEQEHIRNYLKRRSGRVIILLEPGQEHGLDDLFFDWGILADDVIVVERDHRHLISGGDIMLKRFAPHPITQELLNNNLYLITDQARSIREDPGRPTDESLKVTELIASSQTASWGEKNYNALETAEFNRERDIPGPVKVGVLSERKVDSSLGINIPGGKIIVFGSSSFVSNNRIESAGNFFLIKNAINFALDRNTRLNIPPREISKVKLELSIKELQVSRYLIWLGPPAIIGLLGLAIYLIRRY